jgi:hypothetical protein
MIPLYVYSHSDFFDILKIQIESILSLNIGCDIYLFINKPFMLNGGGRLRYRKTKRRATRKRMKGGNNDRFKTILYDDTKPYFQRLSSCIRQLNSPYFILMHENDILIKCDMDSINKIVDVMNTKKIDSVKLLDQRGKSEIHIKDTLYLLKIKDDDRYRFCVNPRLWRRESALNLYESFPEKTYNGSEDMDVQNFSKNQSIYALSDTSHIRQSSEDEYRSKYFLSMNLTRSGNIYQYDKNSETDPIIKDAYTKIKDKYFKNTKRAFRE